MASKKRKVDNTIPTIKVVQSEVAKKPHRYQNLPATLPVVDNPHEPGLAYSYSTTDFYPIGVVVGAEEGVVDFHRVKMQMEVVHSCAVPHAVSTLPKHGVYWFATPVPHQPGTVTLRFSLQSPPENVGSDIPSPMEHVILVTGGGDGGDIAAASAAGAAITAKQRIVRPVPGMPLPGVRLKGPAMQTAPFPPALVVALLDDKARVAGAALTGAGVPLLVVAGGHASTGERSVHMSSDDVLARAAKAAKGIDDADMLVHRLRQLFECLFESAVLYAAERASNAVQKRLSAAKSDGVPYAKVVGAIYLLRLLVVVVQGTDVAPAGGSSSSSSSSSSSLERRQAVSNSRSKSDFHGLEKVVDVCLHVLNDVAHVAF